MLERRTVAASVLLLVSMATPGRGVWGQEQPAPPRAVEEAVRQAQAADAARRAAVRWNNRVGGLFTEALQQIESRRAAGDVLLANEAFEGAADAYRKAAEAFRGIMDLQRKSPILARLLAEYQDLSELLPLLAPKDQSEPQLENATAVLKAAGGKIRAGDTAGAAKDIEPVVKQLQAAVFGQAGPSEASTLEAAVQARVEMEAAKGALVTERHREELLSKTVEAEREEVPGPPKSPPERGPDLKAATAKAPPLLAAIARARSLERHARRYLDADQFARAAFLFSQAGRAYAEAAKHEEAILPVLEARAGMIAERAAAEKASPAGFHSVAFEKAVRRQREADAALTAAKYAEAAKLYPEVAAEYKKAAVEGDLWKELSALDTLWHRWIKGPESETLKQHAAAEWQALQGEAEAAVALRRANDLAAAVRQRRAVLFRFEKLVALAASRKQEDAFAAAMDEAKKALSAGKRKEAQTALARALSYKPQESAALGLAKEAGLSLYAWSFDEDAQNWEAVGSPTVWHHVRDPSAEGGGCLRAGVPGLPSYTDNAATRVVCPVALDLGGFSNPVVRFRHCVKGEPAQDKISVLLGNREVARVTSTAQWAEARVDLTPWKVRATYPRSDARFNVPAKARALEERPGLRLEPPMPEAFPAERRVEVRAEPVPSKASADEAPRLAFVFTSDRSETGPGAYLDTVRIEEASAGEVVSPGMVEYVPAIRRPASKPATIPEPVKVAEPPRKE